MTGLFACNYTIQHYSGLAQGMTDAMKVLGIVCAAALFSLLGPKRLAQRLSEMTGVILAEGEGNLRQRLDTARMANDETGDMGRWINSFIDNLDSVVGQVVKASRTVGATNQMMLGRSQEAGITSAEVAEAVHCMMSIVEEQLGEVSNISNGQVVAA